MKIDVHHHAIPAAVVELLRREAVYGISFDGAAMIDSGVRYSLPEFTDPETKLTALESIGLDGAVLSAATQLFFYHVDAAATEELCRCLNEGFVDYCRQAAGRFRWNALVPLNSPDRAAETLRDADRLGCAGVMIASSVCGRRLDEPEFEPFWSAAEAVGKPVFLHPNYNQAHPGLDRYFLQNVIGNLLETTIAIERLICARVLDRHPGVRVLLPHGGGYLPYQAGRLRHAAAVRPEMLDAPKDPWAFAGRVYFDTLTHDAAAVAYLTDRIGVDNVLVGTDMPYDMAEPDPLGNLSLLNERAIHAVTEENPARIYGFRV